MIPREKRRAMFEDQARWFERQGHAHAGHASRRAADRLAPPAADLNYRWPDGEWPPPPDTMVMDIIAKANAHIAAETESLIARAVLEWKARPEQIMLCHGFKDGAYRIWVEPRVSPEPAPA